MLSVTSREKLRQVTRKWQQFKVAHHVDLKENGGNIDTAWR